MRICCCALLLLTSFAVAQTQAPAGQKPAAKPSARPAASQQSAPAKPTTPAAKPATPSADSSAAIPESAPVITLNGVCAQKTATPANCKTQITRAEFEKIVGAVTTGRAGTPAQLPPATKRNLATQYSQLLAVATLAEKEGVQNTPEAQELVKFARMQALAQAYTRQLQTKLEPTPAEIQSYYNANASKLEQATLDRIFIPKARGEQGKPADETAEKAKADKIRARAVAGESFETLQKEVLEGSGFPTPPEIRTVVQKGSLPPAQESVFNLKPGEVSPPFVEPAGAYIYKLVSKETIPLDKVKTELSQRLLQEKMQGAVEKMLKSTVPVLDENYFGPATAAAQSLPGTPRQPNATTPAPAAEKPSPAPAPEKPAAEPAPEKPTTVPPQ